MTSIDLGTDDMPSDHNPNQRRVIDRQIPVGVIVILCIQIGGGIWFASAQNSTLKQVVDHATSQDQRIDKIDTRSIEIEKSVAILKDRSDDNLETSHRIEEYLHAQQPRSRGGN